MDVFITDSSEMTGNEGFLRQSRIGDIVDYDNTFSLPTCHIWTLGQDPAASLCKTMGTPLGSSLHMQSSAVKLAIVNVHRLVTRVREVVRYVRYIA